MAARRHVAVLGLALRHVDDGVEEVGAPVLTAEVLRLGEEGLAVEGGALGGAGGGKEVGLVEGE